MLQELHCAFKTLKVSCFHRIQGAMVRAGRGSDMGTIWNLKNIKHTSKSSGFKIIDHYYRPSDLPRAQQAWLAIVSQRQP